MRAVRAPHRIGRPESQEYAEVGGAVTVAFAAAALLSGQVVALVPVLVLFLSVAAALCYFAERLSMPGILWMAAQVSGLIVAALWGNLFIIEAELPAWFHTIALTGLCIALILGGVGLLANLAREAILTHEVWRLPIEAPAGAPAEPFMVSLQLPCYAEPPEVVKETMDHLAALDYERFEVLVCDNNTKDEALWKPLEEHCRVLNERLGREVFRFFHVSPLPGAKAGALNYLLDHMAPDAEIIGVIDADYLARPDFLSRLVPFFRDPKFGYLQTPHDYRDYEHSDYLTASYWEYMPSNKVDWPGISEYGGAFTIGTMCLLRTEALRKAGGWAEWCLTEDSEVSVRLRAAGYRGLYFVETFGRGLIPETFDDYKKQRFRWTAGPVQQLRRHWRLFLPSPFAPPMPGWTKLLEIARCMTPLSRLAGLVVAAIGMITMTIALALGEMEPINLPGMVWVLLLVTVITFGLRTVHRYRLSGCNDYRDMIRGEIARASLVYVVLVAGVAGLSSRPLAWRRTPKFAIEGGEESPFTSTMPETIAGMACVTLALVALGLSGLMGFEVALLTALSLGYMAATFFCAPLMAAMAIAHAAGKRRPEVKTKAIEGEALRA